MYEEVNIIPVRAVRTQTYVAWWLLKYTYVLMGIFSGIDKFLNIETNWVQYLSPVVVQATPFTPAQIMGVVGIVEIALGVLVFCHTRWGAYAFALWMSAIIANLVLLDKYYDIIARDGVILIAALVLGLLSAEISEPC